MTEALPLRRLSALLLLLPLLAQATSIQPSPSPGQLPPPPPPITDAEIKQIENRPPSAPTVGGRGGALHIPGRQPIEVNTGGPQNGTAADSLGNVNVQLLEAQVKALEARLAALEKGAFKAPFTVLGNGGKPVLRLSADGFLLLGFDGGNQIGLLAQPAGPARIGVQSGSYTAQMVAGESKAVVEVLNGEAIAAGLTASASTVGLLVEKDGIPAARLGSLPGKGVALRLYDKGGKQVAAAGENPSTPGTGLVAVGNGSQNGAALAANNDGSGVAHAFAADGTVGSGLIGKDRMVAAYNASGNAVVTIGKSENSEGGNVTSRDPAGEGVFRAGFNSAVGGGDACVFRAKKQQTYCLGLGVPGVGVVGR